MNEKWTLWHRWRDGKWQGFASGSESVMRGLEEYLKANEINPELEMLILPPGESPDPGYGVEDIP